MENSAEALKIAFAVFVFVIAISITFMMLSQAKATADTVMYYSDNTNFQETYNNENGEIVGVDDLITTLYKYNKESLAIKILDADGNIVAIFDTAIEANCPWSGNPEWQKQRIDLFVKSSLETEELNGQYIKIMNNGGSTFREYYDEAYIYGLKPLYYNSENKYVYLCSYESLKQLMGSEYKKTFTKTMIEVTTSGEYKTPADYETSGTPLEDDGTVLQITPGGKKVYITYKLNK